MPDELKIRRFEVAYRISGDDYDTSDVDAAYFAPRPHSDLIEFKDTDNQVVFAVQNSLVIYVARQPESGAPKAEVVEDLRKTIRAETRAQGFPTF